MSPLDLDTSDSFGHPSLASVKGRTSDGGLSGGSVMARGEAWLLGRWAATGRLVCRQFCADEGLSRESPAFQGSGVSVITWWPGLPVKS